MTAMTARKCETMMAIMIVTTIVISHRIMYGTTTAMIGILIETATATITTAGLRAGVTVAKPVGVTVTCRRDRQRNAAATPDTGILRPEP